MNRHRLSYILLLLFLIVGAVAEAQVNKWQDIYKVKKKDTMFGIARKYGISIDQLKEANPEMQSADYQLKKGTTVFIPFAQDSVSRAPKAPSATKKEADIRQRAIRVGIMLPLHHKDGDGDRMTEYYRGFLLACEDMKRHNISVDIHAWNVPTEADIRQTLLSNGAAQCDIIFGPLYSHQVKPLADFCKTYHVRMVIPFSITSTEVAHNSQVFQIYQTPEVLNQRAISAFMERFPGHHPVFIDCNDTTSRKGIFTFGLRKQLEAKGIKYNITNIKSSEEMFAKAFSRTQPNVVVLNTGRSPELNIVFAKLDGLRIAQPGISVSMYGYTEWLMYTKYSLANMYKYDTYIPTTFYYNPLSPTVRGVEDSYRRWFKTELRASLPRFALVGYDHAQFFLRGLHQYGAHFTGSRKESVAPPLQSPLYFEPVSGGGRQNVSFQLIHYKPNQTIDTLTY